MDRPRRLPTISRAMLNPRCSTHLHSLLALEKIRITNGEEKVPQMLTYHASLLIEPKDFAAPLKLTNTCNSEWLSPFTISSIFWYPSPPRSYAYGFSLMYSFHFFKVANVRALLLLPGPFLLLLDNVDLKEDVILTSIFNCLLFVEPLSECNSRSLMLPSRRRFGTW